MSRWSQQARGAGSNPATTIPSQSVLSSVGLEHMASTRGVAGSSPAGRTTHIERIIMAENVLFDGVSDPSTPAFGLLSTRATIIPASPDPLHYVHFSRIIGPNDVVVGLNFNSVDEIDVAICALVALRNKVTEEGSTFPTR